MPWRQEIPVGPVNNRVPANAPERYSLKQDDEAFSPYLLYPLWTVFPAVARLGQDHRPLVFRVSLLQQQAQLFSALQFRIAPVEPLIVRKEPLVCFIIIKSEDVEIFGTS